MEYEVLFKTLHGSRLYNLSNAESDWDFYTVVDKVKTKKARYAKQTINGFTDSMVIDLGTWIEQCKSGVPQALEAMFSDKVVEDKLSALRAQFRVSFSSAGERYLRTITNFCLTEDTKRKRHGLRLALNMHDFTRTGRFNPALSENEADYVTDRAQKDCTTVYATAMNIALDRLPPGMLR